MSITSSLRVAFLCLCFCLAGVSAFLLINPQVVKATGCSATCTGPNGKTFSVSCRGDNCTASTGVGCFSDIQSRGCDGSKWDRPNPN